MSMEEISRRGFIGGAAACGIAGLGVARMAEAQPETVTPYREKDELEGVGAPEVQDELLARVLDEPEVEGDLTLPDGRVVPAIYVKLRNRLNRIGFGCGSEVNEHSWDLYLHSWSEQDAQVCCDVPLLQWFNVRDYAIVCGKSESECTEILDDLAFRGLIARSMKSGKPYYVLQPHIAGYWETTELLAFYQNGEDPYACAEVLSASGTGDDYLTERDLFGCTFGLLTTNPISKDVIAENDFLPYMDWRARIMSNTVVGVSACQCMIRNKCQDGIEYPDRFPLKRCLYLGDSGQYFIDLGIAEPISPEEAVQIGEHCVDVGMIPNPETGMDSDIICFCHGEECVQLQGLKALEGQRPNAAQNYSAYKLNYDPEACIGCGACAERCPMLAITMEEDGTCVHSDVCVRCGQCVSVCPASARILQARDDFPFDKLPYDYQVDFQRFFAKERMARGWIKDFTGTTLEA